MSSRNAISAYRFARYGTFCSSCASAAAFSTPLKNLLGGRAVSISARFEEAVRTQGFATLNPTGDLRRGEREGPTDTNLLARIKPTTAQLRADFPEDVGRDDPASSSSGDANRASYEPERASDRGSGEVTAGLDKLASQCLVWTCLPRQRSAHRPRGDSPTEGGTPSCHGTGYQLRTFGSPSDRSGGPARRRRPHSRWRKGRLLSFEEAPGTRDAFGDQALVPGPIRSVATPHGWIVAEAIARV
jgi:hypothetical protein